MKLNTTEKLQLILKKREHFQIIKLKTLHQDDLNQDFKNVQETNSESIIFRSEYFIDTYFTGICNTINTETAQDTVMVICRIKMITQENAILKVSACFSISNLKKPAGESTLEIMCFT